VGRDHDKPSTTEQRNRARTKTLLNALRAMVRDSYQERFGNPDGLAPFTVDLSFAIDPAENWSVTCPTDPIAQLIPQFEGQEAEHGVFRESHVFCFRCNTADCQHTRPGSPREVFGGYDSIGCPQWLELAQFLLDTGDERVGNLYDVPAPLITSLIRGKDLRARQLASFGRSSKTFALLGQVVAGYLTWTVRETGHQERMALTFQVVEARDARGRRELVLNRLCHPPENQDYRELAEAQFPYALRAEAAARDTLQAMAEKLRHPPPGVTQSAVLARVPEVLRKLSSDLAQGHRQSRRQTKHARERREIKRPVDMAMADLRRAKPGQMYRDLRTQAVVLCANKGRCHIFNTEGRHVTSFVIQPGGVASRVRRNRWDALGREQAEQFLDQFS